MIIIIIHVVVSAYKYIILMFHLPEENQEIKKENEDLKG